MSHAETVNKLAQNRTNYQLALKALNANQLELFNALNLTLQGYPLQPYLDYLYLSKTIKTSNETTILNFLKQQEGTFYAKRLRNTWLNHLAKHKKWALFLAQYQAPQPVSQQCLRLQALINTGHDAQALNDLPKLWLVGRSQHKNCDPAFAFWKKKKQLTDDLRMQRILLALEKSQFKLASYLAKHLANPDKANSIISQWKKAYTAPDSLLQQLTQNPKDTPNTRKLIKYAVKQLARKSTDKAYEAWQKINTRYDFSLNQSREIQSSIANRAALNREDRTLEYFADLPDEPWRVRAALWQQNWQAVHDAILSLNIDEQKKSSWQYWLARSQMELGKTETAKETYQAIMMDRDFYSFLAADKLNQPYQMNHKPITATEAELNEIKQRPAVKRLKEFYILGMELEARRQAYALKQSFSPRELQLLASITHKWNWHNQTIALLGKARYWDALDLRFPIVYEAPILLAAKTNDMDPSWLLGIARQESAFNPKARSHVGATGLMQLMPKTAKQISRHINKPLKNKKELLNPARNIELGSAYLKQVYNKHQQSQVLATASYNAGPHRVSRWLPDTKMPADIWIENIPFTETRNYTKSVLSYAAIFDYQRKQTIKSLSSRMPDVNPKTD